MKKILKIFILLTFVFLLVSCDQTFYSKKNELLSFFKSHSLDVTYELQVDDYSADIFEMIVRKEGLYFETSDELSVDEKILFYLDIENNNLFYDLGNRFIYTKITESTTTTELDIEKYISNIKENDNNLTFRFNMYDYLKDSNLDLSGLVLSGYDVKFTATFRMGKIIELSYNIEGITAVMKIGGYVYKKNETPESVGLKEIEFPNINDCLYLTEKEFMTHIDEGASGDIDNYKLYITSHDFLYIDEILYVTDVKGYIYDTTNNKWLKTIELEDIYYNEGDLITSQDGKFNVKTKYCGKEFVAEIQAKVINDEVLDTYKLIIVNHNFTIMKEKVTVSSLYGYIYDTVNNLKLEEIYLSDITYDEEEIYSDEDRTFTVSTEYYGRVYTAEIQALSIYDADVESKILHEDIDIVKYGFTLDNYVYLCDESYLYKFDKKCENMIAKIDLQSIGKSHYVKDNYLYIASYLPYETTYNPSDSYDGYVTQINLEDFTVIKQVHVKCLPNSIIVDNRNNVILSKGANQHVFVDQVNMETGELTPLFMSYHGDVLSYNSNDDTILLITPRHTGKNELYKFDGTNWNEVGYSLIESEILYSSTNELLIFSDGIYRYDLATNEYIEEKFNIIYGSTNYSFYTDYVIVDGDNAYILEEVNGGYFNCLLIYNLNTGIYNRYFFPEADKVNIAFMYRLYEYVYCVDETGIVYKILS